MVMVRALQLLAGRPEVQQNLRDEILEAQRDVDDSTDIPPGIQTFRCTMEDTILPLSQLILRTDGTLLRELAVSRGTNIFVAILANNCSEMLWRPDAYEWKPELWLAQFPAVVEEAHSNI
ncbi:hypothetical protein C2E23DRAFT_883257 [Lenzites betulinus]|nr:hypothetical protein C2E23DRAFT_883257 [Lenzites betulinus]